MGDNMNETNSNNDKNNKFSLREILSDKRKKAGFTLILYLLFFILVFIYMGSVGNNKTAENETADNINSNDTYNYGTISYSKYTPLMNNNYKYKINYYINDKEESYEGERKDDSYSVIPEESYIVDVIDILNIDSVIDLLKESKLDYETKYSSSGVVLQTYNVSIKDFSEEYNILLSEEIDGNIVMKIYANASYVDKIYFDITNLANKMDSSITKYEVEVYFSDVNSNK